MTKGSTSMGLPTGRMEGRSAFVGLVHQALARAPVAGWNKLVLSDGDFQDWPLGDATVVDALQAWAGQGRQLRLLARDFSVLQRLHPRFVRWRGIWSHLIEAQAHPNASEGELPSAIWTPEWMMERQDVVRCTTVASESPERRAALQERIDRCWHLGRPAFPVTVLGL